MMDAQTFLDNFATIADGPNGVRQLRALVLDLAVCGRLVPHDPTDGSAHELISAARDMRADMIQRGLIPRPRSSNAVDETVPPQIPESWAWTSLESVAVYIQRGKGPKYSPVPTSVPVVSQKCIQWSGFDIRPARFVMEQSLSVYGPERFLQPGDLLWNSTGTGTVGRVVVLPEKLPSDRVVADSHVTVIRLANCHPRFVEAWLASTFVQSRIDELTSGTTQQQELNTSTVRSLGLPLPPRLEQDRIVAKVDELMELCYELEVALQKRRDVQLDLAVAACQSITAQPAS
jgi:type I restriction enzyme, S subunit